MNRIDLRRLLAVCILVPLLACEPQAGMDETPEGDEITAVSYECDPDNGGLDVADGFCAFVVADSTGPARHLTVAENGDIFLAMRTRQDRPGGIMALRDADGDGRAEIMERVREDVSGTGIAIYEGYLYFGTDSSIVRFPMTPGELTLDGEPELIASLPGQNTHEAKPITFDGQGNVFVTIGAPSNACQEESRTPGSPGQQPCPQLERHAGIWRFDATTPGQTQESGGTHYATGIRNAVALEWNETAGALFAVQHGRDQLDQLWPDLFVAEQNDELPAEEFFRIEEGDNFGWPYCYYDWQTGQKVMNPEYGGDGETVGDCDQYETPIVAFPGHWAPNDLLFIGGTQFPAAYREGALIAFHGSWNRFANGQRGYRVTFVPFENGQPSGEPETFLDGFTGQEEPIQAPNQADFRPVGLAQGPDGTLYVSDSVKGRIWRVIYTGEAAQPVADATE